MKKIILAAVMMLALLVPSSPAADGKSKPDQYQLFYNASRDYEKRDYAKAVESYSDILAMGLESGNLYYDIGNSYLKLGKLGYAILSYEKAKRLIPHDSDLKANLAYARSLVDGANETPDGNIISGVIKRIFEEYSLRAVIFSATILYLLLLASIALFILRPYFARRLGAVQAVIIILFAVNLTGVALRYYDERILRHGIIVQKQVECKYEPIDKTTTYYTLREGMDVIVLKTRDGWSQIKRPDGKVGWVKKEAVEEV